MHVGNSKAGKEIVRVDYCAQAPRLRHRLFEGPLKMTPVQTEDGPRYGVEGRLASGFILSATPTGSAQCETTANLLKSVVPDAVGERFGAVELVA